MFAAWRPSLFLVGMADRAPISRSRFRQLFTVETEMQHPNCSSSASRRVSGFRVDTPRCTTECIFTISRTKAACFLKWLLFFRLSCIQVRHALKCSPISSKLEKRLFTQLNPLAMASCM